MPQDSPAQGDARDQALDGLDDDALGVVAVEDRALAALLEAAGISRVPAEDTVAPLVAGQRHLFGIDDDDVVAAIHVRRVGRLVLTAQTAGADRGYPADDHAPGVAQQPALPQLRP